MSVVFSLKTLNYTLPIEFEYYGKRFLVSHNGRLSDLNYGNVQLTGTGRELVAIAQSEPKDECRDAALDYIRRQGFEVQAMDQRTP